MELFDKGKRANIYLSFLKGKKIAIKKIKNGFLYNIKNEARFLRILNKEGIGPRLIKEGKDFIKYEFVEGERIVDWLRKNNKLKIKRILTDILKQCKILDNLKINKFEMHNPYKHIIINEKAVMIDFERCKYVKRPKNITQFCQFLMSKKVKEILKEKGFDFDEEKVKLLLKRYKNVYTNNSFNNILCFFGLR